MPPQPLKSGWSQVVRQQPKAASAAPVPTKAQSPQQVPKWPETPAQQLGSRSDGSAAVAVNEPRSLLQSKAAPEDTSGAAEARRKFQALELAANSCEPAEGLGVPEKQSVPEEDLQGQPSTSRDTLVEVGYTIFEVHMVGCSSGSVLWLKPYACLGLGEGSSSKGLEAGEFHCLCPHCVPEGRDLPRA